MNKEGIGPGASAGMIALISVTGGVTFFLLVMVCCCRGKLLQLQNELEERSLQQMEERKQKLSTMHLNGKEILVVPGTVVSLAHESGKVQEGIIAQGKI